MLKSIIIIFLILLIISCSTLNTAENLDLLNSKVGNLRLSLKFIGYTDDQQIDRYKSAALLAEEVLNSEPFKIAVLKGPQQQYFVTVKNESETSQCSAEKRTTYSFNLSDGVCHTNEDIYEKLIGAKWELSVRVNPRWWALWCGFPFVNKIGHREGEQIVTLKCKFEEMSNEGLAAHLIHEYLHIIGFDHPYNKSVNRKYTVPYFIGDKAGEMLEAKKSVSAEDVSSLSNERVRE